MLLQRSTGRGYSRFGFTVSYSPEAQAQLVTGEGLAVGEAVTPLRLWLLQHWKVALLASGTFALALGGHKFFTRRKR